MDPLQASSTVSSPVGAQSAANDDLAQALANVQGMSQSQPPQQQPAAQPVAEQASASSSPDSDSLDFESFAEPAFGGTPVQQSYPQSEPVVQSAPVLNNDNDSTNDDSPVYTPPTPTQPAERATTQSADTLPAAPIQDFTPEESQADKPSDQGQESSVIESIKVSALKQLRPLMQHIELSAEEKFEKYLMMLRASDDVSLIEPAYKAAQQIMSEKIKAQALLDVINEINYLTSKELV